MSKARSNLLKVTPWNENNVNKLTYVDKNRYLHYSSVPAKTSLLKEEKNTDRERETQTHRERHREKNTDTQRKTQTHREREGV